jgi:hypothetical protein
MSTWRVHYFSSKGLVQDTVDSKSGRPSTLTYSSDVVSVAGSWQGRRRARCCRRWRAPRLEQVERARERDRDEFIADGLDRCLLHTQVCDPLADMLDRAHQGVLLARGAPRRRALGGSSRLLRPPRPPRPRAAPRSRARLRLAGPPRDGGAGAGTGERATARKSAPARRASRAPRRPG